MASLPATPLELFKPSFWMSAVPEDDGDDDLFSSSRIQARRLDVRAADGGRVLVVRRGGGPMLPCADGATAERGVAGCHDRLRFSMEDVGVVVDIGVGVDAFRGVASVVLISEIGGRCESCSSIAAEIDVVELRFMFSTAPLPLPLPVVLPPPLETRSPVVFGPTDRIRFTCRTACRCDAPSETLSCVEEEFGVFTRALLLHAIADRRRDSVDNLTSGTTTASITVEWRSEMRIGCGSCVTEASALASRRSDLELDAASPAAGVVVVDGGATVHGEGAVTDGAGVVAGFREMVSRVLAS